MELNFTFRRMPTEKQLTGWLATTPEGFKFAVKAHQVITHIKRLHEAAEFTARFIETLEPLAQSQRRPYTVSAAAIFEMRRVPAV